MSELLPAATEQRPWPSPNGPTTGTRSTPMSELRARSLLIGLFAGEADLDQPVRVKLGLFDDRTNPGECCDGDTLYTLTERTGQ